MMIQRSNLAVEISPEWMEKLSAVQYIAEGAISKVYRAKYNGQTIAIKTLANPEKKGSFQKEARHLTDLKEEWDATYPGTPLVFPDVIEDDTQQEPPFIFITWLEGEKLEDVLNKEPRLEEKDAVALMLQFGRLLGVLHKMDKALSDIKFENLWRMPGKNDDGSPRLMVSDWNVWNETPKDDDFARDLAYASYYLYMLPTGAHLRHDGYVLQIKSSLESEAFSGLSIFLQDFLRKALSPARNERFQTADDWLKPILELYSYWHSERYWVRGEIRGFKDRANAAIDLMEESIRVREYQRAYQQRSFAYRFYQQASALVKICDWREINLPEELSDSELEDIKRRLKQSPSEFVKHFLKTGIYKNAEEASGVFAEYAAQDGTMEESQQFWRWHILAKIAQKSKSYSFLEDYPGANDGVGNFFSHKYQQAEEIFGEMIRAFNAKDMDIALLSVLMGESEICKILQSAKDMGKPYEERKTAYDDALRKHEALMTGAKSQGLDTTKIFFCWTEAPDGVAELKKTFERDYASREELENMIRSAKSCAENTDWPKFNRVLEDAVRPNVDNARVGRLWAAQVEALLKQGSLENAYLVAQAAWFTLGMTEYIRAHWEVVRDLQFLTQKGDALTQPVETSSMPQPIAGNALPEDAVSQDSAHGNLPTSAELRAAQAMDASWEVFLSFAQKYKAAYVGKEFAFGKVYLALLKQVAEKAKVSNRLDYAWQLLPLVSGLEIEKDLQDFVKQQNKNALEQLRKYLNTILSNSKLLPNDQALVLLSNATGWVKRARTHWNHLPETERATLDSLDTLLNEIDSELVGRKQARDSYEASLKEQREQWRRAVRIIETLPAGLAARARVEQQKEFLVQSFDFLKRLDKTLAAYPQNKDLIQQEVDEVEGRLQKEFPVQVHALIEKEMNKHLVALKNMEKEKAKQNQAGWFGIWGRRIGLGVAVLLVFVIGAFLVAKLFGNAPATPVETTPATELPLPAVTVASPTEVVVPSITPTPSENPPTPLPTDTPSVEPTPSASFLLDDAQKSDFLAKFTAFPPNMEAIYVMDSSQAVFLPADKWQEHANAAKSENGKLKSLNLDTFNNLKAAGSTISVSWPGIVVDKSGYYAVWFEDTRQQSGNTGELTYQLLADGTVQPLILGKNSAEQAIGAQYKEKNPFTNVGIYSLNAGQTVEVVLDISKLPSPSTSPAFFGADRIVISRLPTLEGEVPWSEYSELKDRIVFWADDSTQEADAQKPKDTWQPFKVDPAWAKQYWGGNAQTITVTKDNAAVVEFVWQFPYVQGEDNLVLAVMRPVGAPGIAYAPVIYEVYVDKETVPQVQSQIPQAELGSGKPFIMDQQALNLKPGPHVIKVVVKVWQEKYKELGQPDLQLVVDAVILLLKK